MEDGVAAPLEDRESRQLLIQVRGVLGGKAGEWVAKNYFRPRD